MTQPSIQPSIDRSDEPLELADALKVAGLSIERDAESEREVKVIVTLVAAFRPGDAWELVAQVAGVDEIELSDEELGPALLDALISDLEAEIESVKGRVVTSSGAILADEPLSEG